jgi:hypothetical protein
LEEKDNEEEDIEDAISEKATKKGANHVSLSIKDKDETTPIINLIRKQEVIIYPNIQGKNKRT